MAMTTWKCGKCGLTAEGATAPAAGTMGACTGGTQPASGGNQPAQQTTNTGSDHSWVRMG